MFCPAIVFSPLRFIVLFFALFSTVSGAPIKHRRSLGNLDGLTARASTTDAVKPRSAAIIPRAIARGVTIHIRPMLFPLYVSKRAADDLLAWLFPVSSDHAKWTTAEGGDHPLPLSDATLRPHNKGQPAYTFTTSSGKKALKAHYPKGSYRPGAPDAPKGGISFYAPGPENIDLTTAKEATFGYSVMFPEGFEWVKGGKLPGFYGGDDDEVSISCSGGRRDIRCFSARLMWRPEGAGELYTYLPPYDVPGFEVNKKQCDVPNSDCNPTYGTSLNRGSFHFKAGEWTTVSQRVKLNTAGKADGELELFVEGKSTVSVSGLIIRDSDKGRIRGIQMQSFFGGHDADWATPKDQDIYFADLSVAITETL